MAEEEDEITIDFSKIKNFFKKKSEKEKVEEVKEKAEEVKEEVKEKAEEIKQVEEIEKKLGKQEDEARIIDGEKKILDKKLEEEKKKLEKIEEDEIVLDFSKIKNFFKSDKKESKKEEKKVDKPKEDSKKESDDEISFDFSKVKNFFKSGKSESKAKESDEEISFEFRKFLDFIKKYHVVFLILIPLFFSIYLRVLPAYLPITDDWARGAIYNNIQQQVGAEIRSQYPNLPQANIQALVDKRFREILKANKAQIEEQIKQGSVFFKSHLKYDNGRTYTVDIDPYYWIRYVKNVVETGHPEDELRSLSTGKICYKKSRDCVPWDNHQLAPIGRGVSPDMFLAYFAGYAHKFISLFNPKQDVLDTTFIMPIIFSALCVIPTFFIARKVGGNLGGFIAALFVAIHPAFLTRSVGGQIDTDGLNLLFPLMITWLFLESFETKKWKKSAILSGIAGFLVSVYILSWGGWWYIFDFLIVSLSIYIMIYIMINRNNLKGIIKQETVKISGLVLAVFFFSSLLFSILISDFSTFSGAFIGPLGFAQLKEVGIRTVWPNVYTTVAEQNSASLDNVINQIGIGSMLLFLLSVIGIALTLLKKESKDSKELYYFFGSIIWVIIVILMRPQNLIVFLILISMPIVSRILWGIYKKETAIDFKLAIILIIWFISTTYASVKGIRFMLLLVPVFSIGVGIAIGIIYNYLSRFISSGLYLPKAITKIVLLVVILIVLINPIRSAISTSRQEIPFMNDAWYNSLSKIKAESNRSAIINSWWDYGHWFKAIADRAVTFDGTTQDTPMAHWIGYTLMTNNETEAVGILRMLDCGSYTASIKLEGYLNDTAKAVNILHEIVVMDKKVAKEYLLKYVDATKADEILKYTHCEPPEDFFITSDDMIGKSGVWAHFGAWNFDRALIYNKLRQKEFINNKENGIEFLMQRFNYSVEKAENLFYEVKGIQTSEQANSWIAPWPSYASGVIGCKNEEEIILCPISSRGVGGSLNIRIDLSKKEAEINTPQGKLYPNSIAFPTEDSLEKIEFYNNTIGYSITLIPSGNEWSYVMMIHPLEDSMYTRLYFLDGHGLTKFKKFSDERAITGNRAVVWKVDWEGTEKNIIGIPGKSIPNETIEIQKE